MERLLFQGAGVALVTPFTADGVNEEALRELVRFHLREETDALIVNGSTGEAVTMTADEQHRAVRAVVAEAAGRVPVIAGVGGSDTVAVARQARDSRDAGADALLISPPPYNKPTQAGILAHYRHVLDAVDAPVIVYNVPSRTACNILPATIAELAEDARVVGVKEASGDLAQIAELARLVGGEVAIYSGNDEHIISVLALGGQGVISVLANIAPADTARIAHSFLAGEIAEARALQLQYLPLIRALFREPNPVPVKAAVGLLGFEVGGVRLPLLPASDETCAELLRQMRAVHVLVLHEE